MERLFRSVIPNARGSQLIFRQGNPLLPSDLDEVACAVSRTVIIVADNSRCDAEADAQTTRTAVLIDELLQRHVAELSHASMARAQKYRPPLLIVEMLRTSNVRALRFSMRKGACAFFLALWPCRSGLTRQLTLSALNIAHDFGTAGSLFGRASGQCARRTRVEMRYMWK